MPGLFDALPAAETDASLKIVEMAESGMERYLSLRPEQDPDSVRRRFRAGQRCIAAIREDRLVGASWTAAGRPGVRITLYWNSRNAAHLLRALDGKSPQSVRADCDLLLEAGGDRASWLCVQRAQGRARPD